MNKQPIILSIDGLASTDAVMEQLSKVCNSDTGIMDLLSYVKINDIVYGQHGCMMMSHVLSYLATRDVTSHVKIFLDLKLSDTSGTNVNILRQYTNQEMFPGILTIRENCSSATWNKVRELLPDTKLALVSFLTDMTPEECQRRYCMSVVDKMSFDIEVNMAMNPGILDAMVCSPLEVATLESRFGNLEYITPGVRDSWMNAGQQERFAGVYEALLSGADYLVMGAQLTKGNPEKGISPALSAEKTATAVKSALEASFM